MTNWIFLVATLAVAYCRPQISTQGPSAVEIEKQQVVEIIPQSKQLFEDATTAELIKKQQEDNTKEILEKIALVNEQQGLNKKKPKPQYKFPFSYSRSQGDSVSRQNSEFQFPRDPFTNPILDYIENKNTGVDSNKRTPITQYHNEDNVSGDEKIPPGHYIKRKITHQQTMLVPAGYLPPHLLPPQVNAPQNLYSMNRFPETMMKPANTETSNSDLEKQTVNAIKNIVENSRYPVNPYQNLFTPYQYQPMDNMYQMYDPYGSQQLFRPSRQWSPLGQYFPIIIKDPFVQMFNAITSMIEYGPQAPAGAAGDSCRKAAKESEETKAESTSPSRAKQISEKDNLEYSIVDNGKGAEISVENKDDSNLTTVIDIEDLQITNSEDPLKLKLNFRQSKQNAEPKSAEDLLDNPLIQTLQIQKSYSSRQSPPIRDQTLFDDETSEEDEKAESLQITNEGTKKLVSKDNTGNGIFVHKIKVRKGGVAIAGPGGIATAGSGGTAIVGPNGFAYTHPDSLAIAGSGTKVIAVEPTINLSQVVLDHNKNRTRGDGHLPARVGKIVAVGPVIYYNKGLFESTQNKVTIVPYYGGAKGQSLQIVERPDGSVLTNIIKTPKKPTPPEEGVNTSELENPPLPSKQDLDFGSNIRNIHRTALNIIKYQEIAKNGKLSVNDEHVYEKNLEDLNASARNLAQLQTEDDFSFENREGLNEWFERKKSNKREKDKKKKEEEDKKKEEEEKKKEEEEKKKEEEEKRKKEEEKKEKPKEEEEESEEENEDGDAISIGLPPEDASVAEAKPVGLAVAGEGGVAASKPIATAVVGPGGLAIARPVGTAIAGVAPDQALVPIYAEGYISGSKPKTSNKPDAASELLNRIISKYHQI